MAANTGGGITFQFSGDLTQLKRDLNQAANLAKQSVAQTNRITGGRGGAGLGGGGGGGFEEAATSFFTKSRGARRAEGAIGRSIQSLMGGDISGAFGNIASRAGGVGIGTVAGIDAMIQGYQKWSQAMDQVHERQKKIAALTGATVLGDTGSAKSSLSSVAGELSSLQMGKTKDESWWGARATSRFRDFVTGDSGGQRDEEKNALRKKAGEDIGVLAKHQEDLNEAEDESLFGSQRKAALDKERVKNAENLLEIGKEAAAAGIEFSPETDRAVAAENKRSALANDEINTKADIRDAATASSVRMAMAQKENPFDTGALKREGIQEKLGLISQEMGDPMNDERRNALSAERLGLESELEVSEFEETQKTPAQKKHEAKLKAKFASFRAGRAEHARVAGLNQEQFGSAFSEGGSASFATLAPLTPGDPNAPGRAAVAGAKAEQDKYKPCTFEEMDRIFHKYLGEN